MTKKFSDLQDANEQEKKFDHKQDNFSLQQRRNRGRQAVSKTPTLLLKEILAQRGKVVTSVMNPFGETFLKHLKSLKGNRDFLYQELSDRKKRNEILYSIYNNQTIKLSGGLEIEASEANRSVYSSTFEWYVSELLYREFRFYASAAGLKIDRSPDGGDFDVVGATHSGIVAIECKSGKPSGIDESQIIHFVKRHNFLRADYSILYIDFKGLAGNFPFKHLAKAVHGLHTSRAIFQIKSQETDTNANFYAVEGANIYIVDNSINTGNVIKNLRFTLDTHFALENIQNHRRVFDVNRLADFYALEFERVN
ncbi:MAG: hypothetical protein R3B45_02200 [Bdellovibrionota bacterium]